MRFVRIIFAFLILVSAVLIIYLGIFSSTERIKDAEGNVISESIAKLEEIKLGDMKQWILIRGKDETNPILLWLHGGPGAAQMPLAHHLDGEIEEEFVVVHWDQRGAGKSNHGGFEEKTMTFEQFKSDAYELTLYLKEKFERENIYLLGHSWGTQLGIELIKDYPDNYHGYIGVSQVVDNRRQVEIAYDWLLEEIEEKDDLDSLEKLNEIGKPPFSHGEYRKYADLVSSYGGNFDKSISSLFLKAARAPEYNFVDYIRWFRGANRGGGPMHEDGEVDYHNHIEQSPSLEVPSYFFTGKNDYNTPLELLEEYYEVLDAPKKEMVVFEESAHTPFLGETEKFSEELIRIKDETYK